MTMGNKFGRQIGGKTSLFALNASSIRKPTQNYDTPTIIVFFDSKMNSGPKFRLIKKIAPDHLFRLEEVSKWRDFAPNREIRLKMVVFGSKFSIMIKNSKNRHNQARL